MRRLRRRPVGPPAAELELLAVDLETTGLDPRRDHVLALGWVLVSGGEVHLGTARERQVRPPAGAEVGDSATVHGLTDDVLAGSPSLAEVLPELLADLEGRVLLAHHADLELGFLARALEGLGRQELPPAVDTMRLQARVLARPHQTVPPGALRLDAARRWFGLPRYSAHRALVDAVATAELFLAQLAELEHRLGRRPTLEDLSPVRPRQRPRRHSRSQRRLGPAVTEPPGTARRR